MAPWKRVPIPMLVAAALYSPASGQSASTLGRIEGVATISSRLTKARVRVRVYDEPGARTARAAHADHPFANVVLYLENAAALRGLGAQTSAPPPVMRQQHERFIPHVLPVIAGSTVDFPNNDPIYHNVFSLSRAREFDLGRYPRGESKQVRFPKPGVVQVFCHIHSDMSGYILILDHSFFVVPDAQGRFVMEGIPPGEYRLVAWHERIRPIKAVVRVEAGRSTGLKLNIPLPDTAATR